MKKEINKKRFIIPSLEIVIFISDEIITASGDFGLGNEEPGDDFSNKPQTWW